MYNFFDSRANKKAFIKALKEVEKEGYYVSPDMNDEVVFTTNMSRAVASLSGEDAKKPYFPEQTLDVSNLTPENEKPRFKPAQGVKLAETEYTKHSTPNYFDTIFDDDKLLNGEKVAERGLLSNETEETVFNLRTKQSEEMNETNKQKILDLAKQKMAERNKIALAEYERRKEEREKEEEKQKLEEERRLAKLAQEEAALAKVAQAKAEEERLRAEAEKKALEEKLAASAEPPKPKVQRAPRKKRRRYDADIAGGFSF